MCGVCLETLSHSFSHFSSSTPNDLCEMHNIFYFLLLSVDICWHLSAAACGRDLSAYSCTSNNVSCHGRGGNLCLGSLTAVRHKRVTEGEIAGEMNFVLLSLFLSPSHSIFASLKLLHNFARDLIKVAQISLRIRRIVPGTSNEAIRLH